MATGLGRIRRGHRELPEGSCSKEKPSEAARRNQFDPRCGFASTEKLAKAKAKAGIQRAKPKAMVARA